MTFTFTPATINVGAFQIDLDILDEVNDFSNFFKLTVTNNVNSAPSLSTTLVDQTMVENEVKTYAMPTATDSDGDAITWAFTMPNFCQFSGTPPILTFSPVTGDYDDYTITVKVSDPTHTVSYSFHLIVNQANTPNTAPTFMTSLID